MLKHKLPANIALVSRARHSFHEIVVKYGETAGVYVGAGEYLGQGRNPQVHVHILQCFSDQPGNNSTCLFKWLKICE